MTGPTLRAATTALIVVAALVVAGAGAIGAGTGALATPLDGAAASPGGLVARVNWAAARSLATPSVRGEAGAAPIRPEAFDERAFVLARGRAAATPAVALPGVRAVVVPHHWPAGHLILGALRALAASGDWDRVVLLGPDHALVGRLAAFTSARSWSTPLGTVESVESDDASVARLIASGVVAEQAGDLGREHGVAGLVPAIAEVLPGARVVPVAVRADASRWEVARLAACIGPLVDARTVVVVSVDFAHDVRSSEARANDLESIAALSALDADRVRGFGDDHLDARGALAVTLALMRSVGATRFVLLDRADGSDLVGYAGGPVTSYVVGYYGRR